GERRPPVLAERLEPAARGREDRRAERSLASLYLRAARLDNAAPQSPPAAQMGRDYREVLLQQAAALRRSDLGPNGFDPALREQPDCRPHRRAHRAANREAT